MIAVLVALMCAIAPAAAPQDVAPPAYSDVWEWCGHRFPNQPNLQEACRWGAYEMTPTEWKA